ncbi:MAG TPA: S41 family peptidase [Allosphingosinicella sp.]|nr:S41 family peptidase [Allosphingosinicella sp.]
MFTNALVALVAAAAQPSAPQGSPPAGAAGPVAAGEAPCAPDRYSVVMKLAARLESSFVIEDVGKRYAQMLRSNAKAGAYCQQPSSESFAAKVTADLQAIAPDAHLKLFAAAPGGSGGAGAPAPGPPIEAAKMIAPGVAYISFTAFPGDAATVGAIHDFMKTHSGAKALIIDARNHAGGEQNEIDALLTYLYEAPTVLLHQEVRTPVANAGFIPTFKDGPTMRLKKATDQMVVREHFVVPHPTEKSFFDVPVYLLTSKKSASAAEHLALALKRTGRATIIGETTAGAGHFGVFINYREGFASFVPAGRTYDPETGESWEGKGIEPDVPVPAGKALDEALRRIAAGKDAKRAARAGK